MPQSEQENAEIFYARVESIHEEVDIFVSEKYAERFRAELLSRFKSARG